MTYIPVWKRSPNKFIRYEERSFTLRPNATGEVLSGIETIAIFLSRSGNQEEMVSHIKWNKPRRIEDDRKEYSDWWVNIYKGYDIPWTHKFGKITGVAIRSHDKQTIQLPKPNRHHNVIKYMVDVLKHPIPIKGLQGFVTEEGVFLNRIEARLVATRHGQLLDRASNGYELFSEDVWYNE